MDGKTLGCGFCSRYGLPILPVRPGVMDSQDRLPHLPESFTPDIASREYSSYTGRLLREGYLHIYDEMIGRWQDYYVTDKGYYYPLPGSGEIPPGLRNGEMKPCFSKPQDLARASLITLPVMPPPMKNGVFWFGWSENKWTPAVRKMHEDPTVRRKVMQKFDMESWLNSGNGEAIITLYQLTDVVAEYSPMAAFAEIKYYSASGFQPKLNAGVQIINEAERLLPGKGAILVLQDPVAVLQELSSLLSYMINRDLYGNEKYMWKLALSSTLTGLKESMTRQMARDMIADTEFLSMSEKLGVKTYGGLDMLPSPELAKKRNEDLDSNLQRRVDEKWQSYASYYDERQQTQFAEEFNQELNRYDRQVVVPITEMYLAWFKSERLTNYFRYNFDAADIQSGFDYIQTVNYCVAGMQDKALASRYFTTQLQMKSNDYRNILMRALVLNQDEMSNHLMALFKEGGSLWAQPWYGIVDAFKNTFGKMQEAAAGYLGGLLGLLTGSISRILQLAANSRLSYQIFCMMAASSQRAFISLSLVGTEAEFVEHVVRVMGRNAGIAGGHAEDVLRMYTRWELRRLKIDGMPLTGTGERQFVVGIDLERFYQLVSLPENQRIYHLNESLRTEADVDRLLFPRWQNAISEGFSTARSGVPLALGVVSMALQTAALWVSMDFSNKPATASQQEARNRFWAGTLSLTGTTAGTIESAIIHFNRMNAAYPGSSAAKIAGWFAAAGRFLGAAGGLVTAYYDHAHMQEEWQSQRKGLSFAYGASAISGTYLAFAPFINWHWVGEILQVIGRYAGSRALVTIGINASVTGLTLGWIMAGVFLAATFYISWKQTNELQKWLEKTMWGRTPEGLPAEKHPTLQIEMQSLKDIMHLES